MVVRQCGYWLASAERCVLSPINQSISRCQRNQPLNPSYSSSSSSSVMMMMMMTSLVGVTVSMTSLGPMYMYCYQHH